MFLQLEYYNLQKIMKYTEILYKKNNEKSHTSEVDLVLLQRLCFNVTLYQNHILSLFMFFLSCKKTGKTTEPILRSQLDGWKYREPDGPLGLLVAFQISCMLVLSTHSDPWPC